MIKGKLGQGFLDVLEINNGTVTGLYHRTTSAGVWRGLRINLIGGGVDYSPVFIFSSQPYLDTLAAWAVSTGYGFVDALLNTYVDFTSYDSLVVSVDLMTASGPSDPGASWTGPVAWSAPTPTAVVTSGGYYLDHVRPFLVLKLFHPTTRATTTGGLGFSTPNTNHDVFLGSLTADYSTLGLVEMASKLYNEGEIQLNALSGYNLADYTHALVYIRKYE